MNSKVVLKFWVAAAAFYLTSCGKSGSSKSESQTDIDKSQEKKIIKADISEASHLILTSDRSPANLFLIESPPPKFKLRKLSSNGTIGVVTFINEENKVSDFSVQSLSRVNKDFSAVSGGLSGVASTTLLIRHSDGLVYQLPGLDVKTVQIRNGLVYGINGDSKVLHRLELNSGKLVAMNNPAVDPILPDPVFVLSGTLEYSPRFSPEVNLPFLIDSNGNIRTKDKIFFSDNSPPVVANSNLPTVPGGIRYGCWIYGNGTSGSTKIYASSLTYTLDGGLFAYRATDFNHEIIRIKFNKDGENCEYNQIRLSAGETAIFTKNDHWFEKQPLKFVFKNGVMTLLADSSAQISGHWADADAATVLSNTAADRRFVSGDYLYYQMNSQILRWNLSQPSVPPVEMVAGTNLISFYPLQSKLILKEYSTGTSTVTYLIETPGGEKKLMESGEVDIVTIVDL